MGNIWNFFYTFVFGMGTNHTKTVSEYTYKSKKPKN